MLGDTGTELFAALRGCLGGPPDLNFQIPTGSPVIVHVTRATEGQYKALDKDLQVQTFTFKPGQSPLCLEAEGPSQNPQETEPKGQPPNI